MFCITKPARPAIEAFIQQSKDTEFSYRYIGETKKGSDPLLPPSINIDHNHASIGMGDDDWNKAKAAIRDWKMFGMPWVELCWTDTPIEAGETVAILIKHFGFYSLNAARIVYVIDEPGRFGFAYGTLADHGESGEERFLVEREPLTGEVRYDLYAFSRPNHLLAKLSFPLARRLQKRFASDSKAAMLRAIKTIG